jgi:two-component sensor histidine kinase
MVHGAPVRLNAAAAQAIGLAVHELATNAGKYGAFSSARGLLQVSWTLTGDRLNLTWDETEGPPVETIGAPGFGTKLLKSALTPFDGKTEIAYLKSGVHCTMQCRVPRS